MHFTNIATVAVMATLAAAEAQPYRFASMPGLSLMRRSTPGYTPETTKCGAGATCAEACGSDFAQCASDDNVNHCFNPVAKQSCCQDGTGNSCDEGFYCTHDTHKATVCCPNGMDLAACAAAFSVADGLEAATATTPTSSSETPTTSSTSNDSLPLMAAEASVVHETVQVTTTICPAGSVTTVCPSGSVVPSSAWVGKNSTVAASTRVPTSTPTSPAVVPIGTNAAATATATSFSALILVAAGVVALL